MSQLARRQKGSREQGAEPAPGYNTAQRLKGVRKNRSREGGKIGVEEEEEKEEEKEEEVEKRKKRKKQRGRTGRRSERGRGRGRRKGRGRSRGKIGRR